MNPIFAQRRLREQLAKEAKAAPTPPPAAKAATPARAPKVAKPVDPKIQLESLPDTDLALRAKTVYGTEFDPAWDRDTLISKLLEKGATA